MRGALVRALAVVGVVLLVGCVVYPNVTDIGGTRIRPERARLVREADGAALYVELHSTGKFGDVLTGARADVARAAALVDARGAAAKKLAIPGTAIVTFKPGGPFVRLSGLTRQLVAGESVIVTLVMEKTGNLGVVSVVE